jgi:hypothetical protein
MSNTTTAVADIEFNVFNDFDLWPIHSNMKKGQTKLSPIFRIVQLLVEAGIGIIDIYSVLAAMNRKDVPLPFNTPDCQGLPRVGKIKKEKRFGSALPSAFPPRLLHLSFPLSRLSAPALPLQPD